MASGARLGPPQRWWRVPRLPTTAGRRCTGGELPDWLLQREAEYTEQTAAKVAYDMLQALHCCHSLHIARPLGDRWPPLASATASADRAPPVPCPPSEGSGRASAPRSAASAAGRLAVASAARLRPDPKGGRDVRPFGPGRSIATSSRPT